jgi:hypothetical protein
MSNLVRVGVKGGGSGSKFTRREMLTELTLLRTLYLDFSGTHPPG